MNLFLKYQSKIFNNLLKLEKKKVIKLPIKAKNITVELPPRNQKADISCNVAMILAKSNNISPIKLAEIFKEDFLLNFKEFKSIEIGGAGFLNINFHLSFTVRFRINYLHSYQLSYIFGEYVVLTPRFFILAFINISAH